MCQSGIDLQSLETEIRNALEKLHSRWDKNYRAKWSEKKWTSEVKCAIYSVCKTNANSLLNYDHWFGFNGEKPAETEQTGGEWLFDFSWRLFRKREDNKNWLLIETPLVVESEWYMDHESISDDLTKVLTACCGLGVFIHQSAERVEYIDQQIEELCNIGPKRMLVARWTSERFIFTLIDRA